MCDGIQLLSFAQTCLRISELSQELSVKASIPKTTTLYATGPCSIRAASRHSQWARIPALPFLARPKASLFSRPQGPRRVATSSATVHLLESVTCASLLPTRSVQPVLPPIVSLMRQPKDSSESWRMYGGFSFLRELPHSTAPLKRD